MALATEKALQDMFLHGIGVLDFSSAGMNHIPLSKFFDSPLPGQRNPWPGMVYFPWEPYDDGGGAAIAAYQYGLCPFCPQTISGTETAHSLETTAQSENKFVANQSVKGG